MVEELRELINKQPEPVKKLSLAALISFISGIATYVVIFFYNLLKIKFLPALVIATLFALLAIFTGHLARRKIRRGDGFLTGVVLADIDLALGYILIILLILFLVLTLIGVGGLITTIRGFFG